VNYEQYEAKGMIVTFVPLVSDSNQSGIMGSVIISANQNSGAGKCTTKQQQLEMDGVQTGRICDKVIIGIECDPKQHSGSNLLYTRSGPVPSGQDVKTYDLALLQVATSGIPSSVYPSGTVLGEIWISYDLEFSSPRMYSGLGMAIPCDRFQVYSGAAGSTAAMPLGTAPNRSIYNSLGGTLGNNGTNNVYTFPDNFVGTVRLMFSLVGSVEATASIVAGGSSQITGLNDFPVTSTTSTASFVSNGTSPTTCCQVLCVSIYATATAPGLNNVVLSCSTDTTPTAIMFSAQMINPQITDNAIAGNYVYP